MLRTGSDAMISETTFNGNSSTDRGDAVFIDYGSSPSFSNVSFNSNSCLGYGGAIYADDNASQIGTTSPVFINCSFTQKNSSSDYGRAIFAYNIESYSNIVNIYDDETVTYGYSE